MTLRARIRDTGFTDQWPESDLEMVDKTTPDFLTPDENGQIQPFHVYYLTVSGHLGYTFLGNSMAHKHQDEVADMDMSEGCRAYVACNMELDQAVELLIQRLDEAGVLQDTVIAIAGDHYPYGLTVDEISEFRGHDIDTEYEMYQSTFLLWTPEWNRRQWISCAEIWTSCRLCPTCLVWNMIPGCLWARIYSQTAKGLWYLRIRTG